MSSSRAICPHGHVEQHALEDEQQDLLRVLTNEWLDRVEEFSAR
jgi:hypothetical protein